MGFTLVERWLPSVNVYTMETCATGAAYYPAKLPDILAPLLSYQLYWLDSWKEAPFATKYGTNPPHSTSNQTTRSDDAIGIP